MDFIKNPAIAAFVAFIVTAFYLYGKDKLNQENQPKSKFFKPALLNAILVYGILYLGSVGKPKSTGPY